MLSIFISIYFILQINDILGGDINRISPNESRALREKLCASSIKYRAKSLNFSYCIKKKKDKREKNGKE